MKLSLIMKLSAARVDLIDAVHELEDKHDLTIYEMQYLLAELQQTQAKCGMED